MCGNSLNSVNRIGQAPFQTLPFCTRHGEEFSCTLTELKMFRMPSAMPASELRLGDPESLVAFAAWLYTCTFRAADIQTK